MKPESYSLVSAKLSDCQFGWISLSLTAGEQKVEIRLTHVFDPIPDFVRWMEALLADVYCCGFQIEEEGPEKHLSALRRWHARLFLEVSEPTAKGTVECMQVIVHRRQLIEAIYRGFQEFGRSAEYDFREWEPESLAEHLARLTGLTIDQIKAFLVGLDTGSLARFFHAVCPAHLFWVPNEIRELPSLDAMLEFALQPENPIVQESMAEGADNWNFEVEEDDRSIRIDRGLRKTVSAFEGTPLRCLRSEALEAYLASDRDCDLL